MKRKTTTISGSKINIVAKLAFVLVHTQICRIWLLFQVCGVYGGAVRLEFCADGVATETDFCFSLCIVVVVNVNIQENTHNKQTYSNKNKNMQKQRQRGRQRKCRKVRDSTSGRQNRNSPDRSAVAGGDHKHWINVLETCKNDCAWEMYWKSNLNMWQCVPQSEPAMWCCQQYILLNAAEKILLIQFEDERAAALAAEQST